MNIRDIWRMCGPGLVVAATGLGAGDIVAAAVAGAEFGTALLWAVVIGAMLKFCLNEGIGRWQLITRTTLLEGWIARLPAFISWYFFLYLILWTVVVAAALMAATGLAAYALFPVLSVAQWGVLHALLAFGLVLSGVWRMLENLMKGFIALMFVTMLVCAVLVFAETPGVLLEIFRFSLPEGSLASVLSVMGGVGGSVTLLSYGYWIQEEGWQGRDKLRTMRWDLGIAYSLTALFAISVMLLAAGIRPEVAAGNTMALAVADQLVPFTGQAGKWIFLVGFWGAVTSSMVGVWHGVPYLFANFVIAYRRRGSGESGSVLEAGRSLSKTGWYRGYLVFLCFAPMLLLFQGQPVWIVVLYAVTGAFFMPVLAALLLYLNSRKDALGDLVSSRATQVCLVLCLLLFGFLLVQDLLPAPT